MITDIITSSTEFKRKRQNNDRNSVNNYYYDIGPSKIINRKKFDFMSLKNGIKHETETLSGLGIM